MMVWVSEQLDTQLQTIEFDEIVTMLRALRVGLSIDDTTIDVVVTDRVCASWPEDSQFLQFIQRVVERLCALHGHTRYTAAYDDYTMAWTFVVPRAA